MLGWLSDEIRPDQTLNLHNNMNRVNALYKIEKQDYKHKIHKYNTLLKELFVNI